MTKFTTSSGKKFKPPKLLLYGPPGVGKSTLASHAPKPKVIDLEQRTGHIEIERLEPPEPWTYELVLEAMNNADLWKDTETVVLDSLTLLEALCREYVLKTIPKDKYNNPATSLEDYGYGKGYKHLFEQFVPFLQVCDKHVMAGRNVLLLAHESNTNEANPSGDDYKRTVPNVEKLIRARIEAEWDWIGWYTFDEAISEGKAEGGGSRRIYSEPKASFMAKTHTLKKPYPVNRETFKGFWQEVIK